MSTGEGIIRFGLAAGRCDDWKADKAKFNKECAALSSYTITSIKCDRIAYDECCNKKGSKYCDGGGWLLYVGIAGGVLLLIIIIVIIACCCCKKGGRGGGGEDQKASEDVEEGGEEA